MEETSCYPPPGEAINCRYWAEPFPFKEYTRQTLISVVNDNPKRWTNQDLNEYYKAGSGIGITLQQMGYLAEVINHYADRATASDGLPGVYRAVNEQIVEAAKEQGEGSLTYEFSGSYKFGGIFSGVLYSLGDSTVKGVFTGDVRKEKEIFLIINGTITYDFSDSFSDRFETIEFFEIFNDREEAERISEEYFGTSSDPKAFTISDQWVTKY